MERNRRSLHIGQCCLPCPVVPSGRGPLPAHPTDWSLGRVAPPGELGWGRSVPEAGAPSTVPDPEGSHVLPGSPQVLSRAGACWPAGAGSLVMNHVVLPAARSLGRGQGADSLGDRSVSSPAWPAEAAAGQGACGAHTESRGSLSLGPHTRQDVGLSWREHLPALGQPLLIEWVCAGLPELPPVCFGFLEQWRVTECPPPPPAGWRSRPSAAAATGTAEGAAGPAAQA